MRVAFQGEVGAYSEEAAHQFFGPSIETVPYKDLSEVFRAAEKGEVEFAIVPIENSLEGSVTQTFDLLLDSDLKICGELKLRIVHCLIAAQGTDLHSIETVYSHPQALGQCRKFLENLKYKIISTYDTAGSVMYIKEKNLIGAASIASERAAEIYDMKVLAKGIEDDPNNFTRFFALGKQDVTPTGRDKTSIIFTTKHVPGALFKALEAFAIKKINLTKIESRPIKGMPWEYNFYLDFEGHRTEKKCQEAFEHFKDITVFFKILGSYPKAE